MPFCIYGATDDKIKLEWILLQIYDTSIRFVTIQYKHLKSQLKYNTKLNYRRKNIIKFEP
jgi:hypothetical protein